MTFEELNLAPAILQAVQEQGYTEPTAIQQQALPIILARQDLLAGAQTGTGKTAGFTLPMLHILSQNPAKQEGAIRALVLAPTRELAAQVEESIKVYGKHLKLKSTVIFGGVGMKPQINRIAKGIDILVATPGRLLDLQEQNHIDLSQVEMLVLDEADRMLDMGFIHDVKKVIALLPETKQSLLFSATFSDEIRELANSLLKNPQSVQVTPPNTTVELIKQIIYPVGRNRKKDVLAHLIESGNWSQVLVFTRTKFGANKVADFLNTKGIKAMALHGNKSQSARTQALAEFKSAELRALVATDIAARGIDIDELPHVVNFDIPNVPEDYVHRIGRTGRAGQSGQAVSLVCLDEEGFMYDIETFTKQEIPVEIIEGFGPEEGETAEPIAMGRQTLWGGLGKPPSREIMQAAARAARAEMMQRIRENKGQRTKQKASQETNSGQEEAQNQQEQNNQNQQPRQNQKRQRQQTAGQNQNRQRQQNNGQNNRQNAGQNQNQSQSQNQNQNNNDQNNNNNRRRRNYGQNNNYNNQNRQNWQNNQQRSSGQQRQNQRQQTKATREFGFDDEDQELDYLPRNIDPLQTNLHGRRKRNTGPSHGAAGQPDPMQTSIDLMGQTKNRNRRRY